MSWRLVSHVPYAYSITTIWMSCLKPFNPPEVTSSVLPAPAAITRGNSATWDLVGDFMTDGGEAAYNFWEVWVDDKLRI